MTIDTPLKGARYFPHDETKTGIILLHAYTGSPLDVNLLARKLHRSGYAVLCPQFTGHGSSQISDLFEGNPEIWCQDTKAAIEFLQSQDLSELLIFGLSLGGIFATWALTQKQWGLAGGGVFNSPVVSPEGIDISGPFMAYVQALWSQEDAPSFDDVRQSIKERHLHQIAKVEAFAQSFWDDLAEIEAPFFICQSGQDELIDPMSGDLLGQKLIRAKLTLKCYPENTHVITVNKNRAAFEEDLLHFIKASTAVSSNT